MDLAGWERVAYRKEHSMSEKLNVILEAARLHAEEVILPHVDD